jgi:hypothetical protein
MGRTFKDQARMLADGSQFPRVAYTVVDVQTGQVVGHASTLHRAHARADRFDTSYGAVRYTVRRIEVTP